MISEYATGWPPKPGWGVWKWVKEETNITVDHKTYTSPESLALSVASGEMPDIMSVYPTEVQKFGPQGAFLDLSKHMDKMPNVKKFLAEHPDITARITQPDGKILSLLNDGTGEGNQLVWFYRDDIFAKHNLQPPKTWDEMYTTAKKLKELYPDSYPLVFRHGIGTLITFGPSFGIYPEYYKDPTTGKMKYGATDPNFKKMVEYLNKFYMEGLFPKDWLSMDYKGWTQFITTNKSFMSVQFIGQIEIMNNQLQNGGHLKFMAPPLGAGSKAYLPNAGYEDRGFAVASNTKNLDAVLRFFDYVYSEKGRTIQSWGKEGETYTVVNGKKKFNDTFKTAADITREAGIGSAGTYGWFDYEAWLSMVKPSEQEPYIEAKKYRYPTAKILPILSKEETDSISTQQDQINKYYTTAVSKFIMGETPMTEWDSFVSTLNQYGLQKVLDTYQKALDRQKK
ncbi:extracellular solute-binding protein [Paenibacillus flagellatus]|uniref:extracellular solute-binding protein n=1 Tax=Paenibacillus flagellatus TaxID=2211139 RepID=UPI0013051310|nr:extracellular solute-binding protein [Paenibacillus flagellatus]